MHPGMVVFYLLTIVLRRPASRQGDELHKMFPKHRHVGRRVCPDGCLVMMKYKPAVRHAFAFPIDPRVVHNPNSEIHHDIRNTAFTAQTIVQSQFALCSCRAVGLDAGGAPYVPSAPLRWVRLFYSFFSGAFPRS